MRNIPNKANSKLGKIINEVGNKYGRLTVLSYHGMLRNGNATWLCNCECGKEKVVEGYLLRRGTVKSCGCLWHERKLKTGEAATNELYIRLKKNAKRRGYSCGLSRETFGRLINEACSYCGTPPSNILKVKTRYEYIYNGLDRVDNNIGYEIDNVVSCCKVCNYAKRRMTTEEFFDWIKRVHDHSKFFLGR